MCIFIMIWRYVWKMFKSNWSISGFKLQWDTSDSDSWGNHMFNPAWSSVDVTRWQVVLPRLFCNKVYKAIFLVSHTFNCIFMDHIHTFNCELDPYHTRIWSFGSLSDLQLMMFTHLELWCYGSYSRLQLCKDHYSTPSIDEAMLTCHIGFI